MMYKKIFDHIEENKPIHIKNFYPDVKYKKSINEIIKLSKLSNNTNKFLKGSKYIKLKSNQFINDILRELNKNKNIKATDEYRIWQHKKNNITPWHYDGNGIDVINICFTGKKKFLLAEPNSQITFSFTNLTILETNNKLHEFILEPGDLLLIPRFWFHKVISLENDTTTMNFCITNKYRNNNVPKNLKMLYNLHNLFKTRMSENELICSFPDISISFEDFIYYFLKENIILFILFLTLRLVLRKFFNTTSKLKNNLNKYFLFSLFVEYNYQKNSVGISRLLTIVSFFNNLLIDNLI